MLTTIEQKLSAIKAINEEKDSVDHYIEVLNRINPDRVPEITLCDTDVARIDNPVFPVTPEIVRDFRASLIASFTKRQQELISHAQELMK